jgi:hypothetical protein
MAVERLSESMWKAREQVLEGSAGSLRQHQIVSVLDSPEGLTTDLVQINRLLSVAACLAWNVTSIAIAFSRVTKLFPVPDQRSSYATVLNALFVIRFSKRM